MIYSLRKITPRLRFFSNPFSINFASALFLHAAANLFNDLTQIVDDQSEVDQPLPA